MAQRDRIVADMKKAVEVGKRCGAKWCTVVPRTYDLRRDRGFQVANAIDNLRRAADVCEPSGLVMVVEALNWTDHPNAFPDTIGQAFLVCRAVNHPSCKLIFDLYHQQITDGNLIRKLDEAWSEIGYIQTGDHPGRASPAPARSTTRTFSATSTARASTASWGWSTGRDLDGPDQEVSWRALAPGSASR